MEIHGLHAITSMQRNNSKKWPYNGFQNREYVKQDIASHNETS